MPRDVESLKTSVKYHLSLSCIFSYLGDFYLGSLFQRVRIKVLKYNILLSTLSILGNLLLVQLS